MAAASMLNGQRLQALLAGLAAVPPGSDREIAGLALDSRGVRPGDLFLAVPGTRVDGRAYVADAVARGAAAVLYEPGGPYEFGDLPVPALGVSDLRRHLGAIADRYYGSPSRRLRVIGITGTNGKTTCSYLLAQVLDAPARRCGIIGTLGDGFPGALEAGLHTTPDPIAVHRWLAALAGQGASAVCMEVSSHALDQGRVCGVVFDVAVLTNLSRDHLDYHGDMAAYRAAKAALFDWPGLRCAVVNIDDELGQALATRLAGRLSVVTYGLSQGAVHARTVQAENDGLRLVVATPAGDIALRSALLGRFNVANLLAVTATLVACGVASETIAARLPLAQAAPGRMERFAAGGPQVVVDYAHTPDALEKVLSALREHTAGRLWCVFGCGGDRDRGKRPQMGRAAERLADHVILSNDNPRHEDPERIIADILEGMASRPRVIPDRREAIRTALVEAGAGDTILVAGKGHEDYQQIGDERRPYSDRTTVMELLGLQS